MCSPSTNLPPPSITSIPEGMMNKNKLKLLDIDHLELARQLTLLESALFKKITATEILQRAREQLPESMHCDHITDVIQMTNKIARWVVGTILGEEDSHQRATVVEHFISTADGCRNLHNYSSMAAVVSGLNAPPIRRLRETWEQVSGLSVAQLGQCEITLDSVNSFTNYKAALASISPPCVPFIGVYLVTLAPLQDESEPDGLGSHEKADEVVREIKHWQSSDFLLNPLSPVQSFIEESLENSREFDD